MKPLEESGEMKKSLGGFLAKNDPSTSRALGGSASVAGDQIAISKESSLTGEVYVRADGKKGKHNNIACRWCKLSNSPYCLL